MEVLQFKEVDKPTPMDNRVLVKIYAASVNKKNLAPLRGAIIARLLGTGLLKPKHQLLGDDLAGKVEAVGKDVKQFKIGDEVFGVAPGAFAEYACAREDLLAVKPTILTFEEAAAAPVAAITALQGLRAGKIQPGQKVLIIGASGGVGTFAVQIAKSFETEVTAVCSHRNVDNIHSMGIDHVINYHQEKFTNRRQTYDLILAINGYHSIIDYRNALNAEGTCVVLGGEMPQIFQALIFGPLLSKSGGKKIGFMGIARLNHNDLILIKELLEDGKIKSVIDKCYPLCEAAEAVQYLEEGHARGKVVISMVQNKN